MLINKLKLKKNVLNFAQCKLSLRFLLFTFCALFLHSETSIQNRGSNKKDGSTGKHIFAVKIQAKEKLGKIRKNNTTVSFFILIHQLKKLLP